MGQGPPYSADRFPMDFVMSAIGGIVAALVCGPLTWQISRRYLQQAYPHNQELLSAAIVAGVVDGFLFGIGGFIATFAVRIFRYERAERRRSDHALRRELEGISASREGRFNND